MSNKREYIAKTLYGLENITAEEIEELGGTAVEPVNRAVIFHGDKELLYKVNLWSRTSISVLMPVLKFECPDEEVLYKEIKKFPWEDIFSPDDTFVIASAISGTLFTHSRYVALKSKDAIADRFREKYNRRPSVDTKGADFRINIHIAQDRCTVSLDSSGEPLSHRKYRLEQTEAPLSEVLAAGLLRLSGWTIDKPLLDPMCGSGTIIIEAAMVTAKVPPGRLRSFAFEKWKDFDNELWTSMQKQADAERTYHKHKLVGQDKDKNAVRMALSNAERAGISDLVHFEKKDFFETSKLFDSGYLIINPPYDERIQEDNIKDFYKKIGDQMKTHFSGYDAWIISGNIPALKSVGLRPSRKIPVFNGPIECRFMHFPLYKGSKKAPKQESHD